MIHITGKVIHGQKYGKVLGFPTANLDRREYSRKKMKIKLGVYAGWAAWTGLVVGAVTRLFERLRNLVGEHREFNENNNMGWVIVGVFAFIMSPLWLKFL